MKIFYSAKTKLHHPTHEINNGEKVIHPETPKREEVILAQLSKEGFRVDEMETVIPAKLLTQVHTKDYIRFIKQASMLLEKGESLYPDVFLRERARSAKNNLALIGKYSFDVYTPITQGTYTAALAAASLAFKGASEVACKDANNVYILSRPVGHHAFGSIMGGYSYFNNAAIASEYLSHFGRVAILDLDFHHGHGTQDIFYERDDVLFVSIHADPKVKYPYYWGYKEEKGRGKGLGYNFNYPLPLGTGNDDYQKTLEKALKNIQDYKAKFLVISLGFDTYKDDPIGGFKLTTDYYQKAAQTISSLNLPMVIIQEGGYDVQSLGKNVTSFLRGIEAYDKRSRK